MSLINKMLQDLDARGGDGARGDASSSVRPVSYAARSGLSAVAIGACVVALAVLGGGGYAAYKYFRGGAQPVLTPAAVPAVQAGRVQAAISDDAARKRDERIAAARRAAEEQAAASPQNPENSVAQPGEARLASGGAGKQQLAGQGTDAQTPRAANASGRRAAGAPEERAAVAATGTDGGQRPGGADKRAAVGAAGTDGGQRAAGGSGKRAAVATKAADSGRGPGASAKGTTAGASRDRRAADGAVRATPPVDGATRVASAAGGGGEQGLSSQQKAENEYRRALASLQDARVNDAVAGLEQAVYLYPRHAAARQTLVSLLIEGGRPAEAMRHMIFATSLDPRQVDMAMLLARMQLEHGGNALDTLQRSLPFAESKADYRALMAGVLQRQNRHKEAADHYQAAVRLQPGNAVWWMGMGISLQADQRNAEAKVAFQRARDIGRLTPELQSFVERRLQQLN